MRLSCLDREHFRQSSVIGLLLAGTLAFGSCSWWQRRGESEEHIITDETGRQVYVSGKIERVISLAPNLTEIIYAIDAGGRLVGNTTYCDYPEQAKTVQKVGDTLQPNIERILALRPKLIFISTASQLEAFTRQLNEHESPSTSAIHMMSTACLSQFSKSAGYWIETRRRTNL